MFLVRRPSLARRFVLVAAALAIVSVATPAPMAAADDGVTPGQTVVGQLVQAWPEQEDPGRAAAEPDDGPLSWVRAGNGRTVRVDTDDVASLPVGATVAVTVGEQVVDDATREDGYPPARDVVAASVVRQPATLPTIPAPSPMTNAVTVALVVPAGGTQDGTTLDQVVDAVNGPVHDFWAEQTDGAVQVGVAAAHDWLTTTANCTRPTDLWDEVARDVGFTPGPGKHLLLYVTKTPAALTGCSYGLAQVGRSITSGGDLYVRDTVTSVIAHELGHNFGLGHSSERQCDGSVDMGSCRTVSYEDLYDVMGASWDQLGSLNAAQAVRLGVLPAGAQQTLPATATGGTFTLAPLSGRTGIRGLKLVGGDGAVYWLEYRPASGRDSWLGTAADWTGLPPGVLLHRATSGDDTSWLMDGTPSAAAGWDADTQQTLPIGQATAVSYGEFTVTITGETPSAATLTIATGPSLRSWTPATNRLPRGNLEVLSASGTTLSVGGWVFDPDQPAWPVAVHVYVDGGATPLVANGSRPDVGGVFPQAGDAHGFGWAVALAPGQHSVCVYAIDPQLAWAHTTLGCRTVAVAMTLPRGNWENTTTDGTTLSVSGWAFDPDSPTSASAVHVYVDGGGTALAATGNRPDVGAVFPDAGPAHGFSFSTTVAPGNHTVCLYAIDQQLSWLHTVLGCRSVAVAVQRPRGNWESVSVSGNTLSLAGWAFDPDSPSSPSAVHVYVDGSATVLTADQSRPDVGTVFPQAGSGHGFGLSATISPGDHTVCVYAIDREIPWLNTPFGCRRVTVSTSP